MSKKRDNRKGRLNEKTSLCPVAGKRKYATYGEALAKLETREDPVTGLATLAVSVYSCDYCGSYHHSSKRSHGRWRASRALLRSGSRKAYSAAQKRS